MGPKLEASPIIFEFLDIVRKAPVTPVKALQRLAVRGAVEIIPPWLRERLRLSPELGLRKPGYETLLKALGAAGERLVLAEAPPAQACVRVGLPADYLYR